VIYKLKTDKGCSIEVSNGIATITGLGYKWTDNRVIGQEIPVHHVIFKNFEPDYFNTYYKQL